MNCNHETTEFRRQRYGRGESLWQKVNQCLICGERIPFTDINPFWPEDCTGETLTLSPFDCRFALINEGCEIVLENIRLRAPCKACGNSNGFVYSKNKTNVCACSECGAYSHTASNKEMGLESNEPTRLDIVKRAQRARILSRDGARCLLCGKTGKDDALHIAHIISDYDAQTLHHLYPKFKLDYIYHDENLFACCSECNLGQGKESLIPKLAAFVSFMIRKNKTCNPA
jgi:5-methylcytosine-specific restriction endonuclease McrA